MKHRFPWGGAASPPSDGEGMWALATWNADDQQHISRWRLGLTVPEPKRPIKVTVKVGYRQLRPDGLPDKSDLDAIEKIERVLDRELVEHDAAMVLILTGNYAREFIGYGRSSAWLVGWGPTVLDRWGVGHPGSAVDAQVDPEWSTFRDFTKDA